MLMCWPRLAGTSCMNASCIRSRPRRALSTMACIIGSTRANADRHQAQALQRLPLTGRAGFVVLGVLVDVPDVVNGFACQDVLDGEHSRHHGMVLVVVLVHAVAADEMQRREALGQFGADRLDVLLVALVVDGIGLLLAHDATVLDVVLGRKADDGELLLGERYQVGIGGIPESV